MSVIASQPAPRIVAVGTALPDRCYEQEQLAELLAVPAGVGRRVFRGSGIDTRYLYAAPDAPDTLVCEDQEALLTRHRRGALELSRRAIENCLSAVDMTARDIDFLCCVTSTGFVMPGLSAMCIRHLGFRPDCQRIDIVAMGCNAALNGMNATAGWAAAHRSCQALLVCCEINSAIHVRDDRVVTSVVNSLFGDGCGAVLLTANDAVAPGPRVLGFSSHIVPDAWRAISFHWSTAHNKFELYLDKDIPVLLGEHSPKPIGCLLRKFSVDKRDVRHWLVHAGGKKVISAIAEANGLTGYDVRHSSDVLRRCGNLGSATVLFSYESLLHERTPEPEDYGVMVTMGPGATIETALLRW